MPSEIDLFKEYLNSKDDADIGIPTTAQEVSDFEEHFGIRFPADLREYFLKLNGVDDAGGLIVLEPLHNWCRLTEYEYGNPEEMREHLDNAENYFRFGGYDIHKWDWSISLTANPADNAVVVSTLQGSQPKVIGASFSDFLHKYRVGRIEDLLA